MKSEEKNLFINRELSWLEFNERVLEEAFNIANPLLERLKFLSISASNLDEFFMVRVAGIKNYMRYEIKKLDTEHQKPQEQLENIREKALDIIKKQGLCWDRIKIELALENIHILSKKDYQKEDLKWLDGYFRAHVLPNLKPIIVDFSDEKSLASFPLIPGLKNTLVIDLDDKKDLKAVVVISKRLERFIQLPAKREREQETLGFTRRFALLDHVLDLFKDEIVPDYKIKDFGIIRVTRDSELEVSDDTEDLIFSFESALKKRVKGDVIRLQLSSNTSKNIQKSLLKVFGTFSENFDEKNDVYIHQFLGLRTIIKLFNMDRPKLKFDPHHIRFPERIDDFGGDCFAAIDSKDIVVHHPYESFDVVAQFIRQASRDPEVISIKQTLYRTSNDSPIVKALINAAKAGKDVTAIVELKARFDEEANIKWGKNLENAGAKVIYGLRGLKTHAKVSLIHRKIINKNNDEIIRSYVHYGTGNYHPVNAKVYSDLSFFTCDTSLCKDTEELFDYIIDNKSQPKFTKISAAPISLKPDLLELIEKEKELARAGKPAAIWIKLNSLVEKKLIKALYEASNAGVSIDIIARGICCLKPGIKGLSENIRVKSIVGRFLEHARIFCFGDGHKMPSEQNKVFISSADWMPRNVKGRIEVMVPIENPTVHQQILSQIMLSNIKDKKQSWIMQSDGSYKREKFNNKSFSAHDFFMSNPSLSGRGTALNKNPKKLKKSLEKTAVIDIGSNSVRLVVYDGIKRVPLPIFNEKVLCGLAKNMETTGHLREKGVKKAKKLIKRFIDITDSMNVDNIFYFATAAVRDAKDGKDFVDELENKYSINIEVLSGEEEANLAALGIASAFHEADGVVCDLGGGSLELAQITYKHNEEIFDSDIVGDHQSFPIGALRLNNLSNSNNSKALKIIDENLKNFPLEESLKAKNLYAVGGGFRALAKIHIEQESYPLTILEHYEVSPEDFCQTLDLVCSLSEDEIEDLEGMSATRASSLAVTALTMKRIIEIGKPENIIFSTHGVREGLLFSKLDKATRNEDGLVVGCSDMISNISHDFGASWVEYGKTLHLWMSSLFPNESTEIKRLRLASCILSHLAWYEHTSYRAEIAFRWVLDSEISSISHQERVFIATAIFHRYQSSGSKIKSKSHSLINKKMINLARIIGLAMHFGYDLSGGATKLLSNSKLTIKGNNLVFSCPEKEESLLSDGVIKRFKKLADAMDLKPKIK